MTDDSALLRRFVKQQCQSSFAELVQRHLGLVYHSALRQTDGDTQLAEDAAQATFTLLAAKASNLCAHPELAGWLYTTACLRARELRRGETRRRQRELTVSAMSELHGDSTSDAAWQRVRPLIDDALLELPPEDRAAVLLRHFEGRPFAEVGATLKLGENAARMRVDRAVDRLQGALAKRGVTSTSTALASVLSVPAALAVPAGLAGQIAGVAVAAAGVPAGSVAFATLLKFMTASKWMTAVAAFAAAAAVGTAWRWHGQLESARTELATLQQQQTEGQTRLRALETRLAAEKARADGAARVKERLQAALAAHPAPPQPAAAPARISPELVKARYEKGKALADSGHPEEALQEFLWCYDTGMRTNISFMGVRTSYLLSDLVKLAKVYPPAQAALNERRDAAEVNLLASANDFQATMECAAVNQALGEDDRNLVLFDALPAGDPRRTQLGTAVADQLIDTRRYGDLVQAIPYPNMEMSFDVMKYGLSQAPNLEAQAGVRRSIIENSGKNIEALAGAGDTAHAAEFIGKVLAFDGSPETRALLAKHFARAGHPELLGP
jgi:RNA polymerase sigma factor (sigma-70 family)